MSDHKAGVIAFFTHNPLIANLMMAFLLIIGTQSYFTIQKQMFPNAETFQIKIDVSHLGASPQEIEETILIKIEKTLKDIAEIKSIVSKAYRSSGDMTIELEPDADTMAILDKIKLRIDRIASFPVEMEPIGIYQVEFKQEVIQMVLAGNLPLEQLKPLATQIETDLLQLKNVSLVSVTLPQDEIAIEIQPMMLKKYGLTFEDVTEAINSYSANISAGELRTDAGIVSVRVQNQFYVGDDFSLIPVKVGNHGSKVLLGDIAAIKDGFVEGERHFKYSGKNAIYMTVEATTDQDMTAVARSVHAFIANRNEQLPKGIELSTVVDMTTYLNERLDMMLENLFQAAVLVGLLLSVFLRFKLALWVMVGLPVCFLGAVMMMPAFGVTLNIVSLFAFIMVLGILVDDAAVISESVDSQIEQNGHSLSSVINGTHKVSTPAIFGVLTTMAVFVPFGFSNGADGSLFFNISMVVILCLLFSLIESKLILPAHLGQSHLTPQKQHHWRSRFNAKLRAFTQGPVKRATLHCLQRKWLVLFGFIGFFVLSVSLIVSSAVRVVSTPRIAHDFPIINIEMNSNSSDRLTLDAIKIIETVVMQVERETLAATGKGMIQDILVIKEDKANASLIIPLVQEQARPYDTFELSRRWRNSLPEIPGLKSIFVQDDVNSPGEEGDFGYLLYGTDIETLNEAGRSLIAMLQKEPGLYDISSSIDPAGKEIQISLLPVAYDLGLDLKTIAGQLGTNFYGGEVQRLMRNGEEVRVVVRYPEMTRSEFSSLKYSLIDTENGDKVALGDVAVLQEVPSLSYIRREGGHRSVYVYGAIDRRAVEPRKVVSRIKNSLLVALQQKFPAVKTELGGAIKEQRAQANQQSLFFIVGLITVYILLALPLKSYTQPLIVMSVIPFSLAGAIWGHLILGIDFSFMSFFGVAAATGVLINNSLVLVHNINQQRSLGAELEDALVNAVCARFRAILLTSITTFAGVLPIMLESSLQAQFVVPMAVSLGFSVLFATVITLFLLPCIYLLGFALNRKCKALFTLSGGMEPSQEAEVSS